MEMWPKDKFEEYRDVVLAFFRLEI